MPKGIYKKSKEHKRKISETLKGRKLSLETKQKISKSMKGFHPKTEFKKGHKINNGRISKRRNTNVGRSNHTARKILEAHLGRKLKPNEVVHHIDNDYTNNKLDNLKVMDWYEHQILHRKKQKFNNQKLSKEDTIFIGENPQISYLEIAEKFGICPTYVYEIRKKYNGGRLLWQIS